MRTKPVPHASVARIAASGTQNTSATSILSTIVISGFTTATNGRMINGGSDGVRGLMSSSVPRMTPSRARSTPVSSHVSRIAVCSRSRSPGSIRPPGHAMWPLHGSRSASARLIINSSGSPSGDGRSTSAIAASRAMPSGSSRLPRMLGETPRESSDVRMGEQCVERRHDSFDVATGLAPTAKAGDHRRDVLVAHLLQSIGGENRSASRRAVDDDVRVARNPRLDLRLEIAARDVHGPGNLAEVHLVEVANVEERDRLATRLHLEHLLRRDLGDARMRFGDELGGGFHSAIVCVGLHWLAIYSIVSVFESASSTAVRAERKRPLVGDVAHGNFSDTRNRTSVGHLVQQVGERAILVALGRRESR